MYETIITEVNAGELDGIVLKDKREADQWRMRLVLLTVEDGRSMYDIYKVPTEQQMEQYLQPTHYATNEHVKYMATSKKYASVCDAQIYA